MGGTRGFVLVANTRLPSQRAQALQVVQSAAGFARQGPKTTLLVAERRATANLPEGVDVLAYYGVAAAPRPQIERAPCIDWIERVPRALQFLPSRVQEWSFARHAAAQLRARHAQDLILARDIEVGAALARAGHPCFLLEIHRVPGGRWRRRWLREAASASRGVIAISNGVREDLIALGIPDADIRVEHDAFEPTRFAALPTREQARVQLGLDPKRRWVVYTGGLLAWKGVDVLAEAARELRDVGFVVAGGMSEDVEALRARSGGLANLRIDGFQAPDRVPLYLAAGDVGVVPNRSSPAISARYTSPLKVFEAFAAGLPLVASDLPSLRELLTDGVDALLVAPDDPAALARGLRRLLEDDELRASFSRRGRERARGATWELRAKRILEWAALRGCPAGT